MALPAGTRLGPYEIAARMGAGGIHATIELPSDVPLALGSQAAALGFDGSLIALTPDGRRLAYIGKSASGTQVYQRDVGGSGVRPVAGTEGAIYAFFSPDSRWLGFLTRDQVKKVSLDGGAPITLSDARNVVRASWTSDDGIYFAENEGSRISRVAAVGGSPPTAILSRPIRDKISQILPDGKTALITSTIHGISTDYADVLLVSLTTSESNVLIRSAYDARYEARAADSRARAQRLADLESR